MLCPPIRVVARKGDAPSTLVVVTPRALCASRVMHLHCIVEYQLNVKLRARFIVGKDLAVNRVGLDRRFTARSLL